MLVFETKGSLIQIFADSDDGELARSVHGEIQKSYSGVYVFYGYGTHTPADLRQIADKLDELNGN